MSSPSTTTGNAPKNDDTSLIAKKLDLSKGFKSLEMPSMYHIEHDRSLTDSLALIQIVLESIRILNLRARNERYGSYEPLLAYQIVRCRCIKLHHDYHSVLTQPAPDKDKEKNGETSKPTKAHAA